MAHTVRRISSAAAPEPEDQPSGENISHPSHKGLLTPTFTSLATAVGFGAIASFSVAAASFTLGDKIILGTGVAVGTYLTCKIGKALLGRAGVILGGIGGFAAGAPVGAIAGGVLSSRGERAVRIAAGSVAAGRGLGTVAALVLGTGGALTGFWGGAYAGHHMARAVMLEKVFNADEEESQPVTPEETPETRQKGEDGDPGSTVSYHHGVPLKLML